MRNLGVDFTDYIVKKQSQSLAFSANADYAVWKSAVHAKYSELLGLDAIKENACPLNMEIVEKVQKDGYSRIRFEFESERGSVVPATYF